MFCRNCNASLQPGQQFCPQCGMAVASAPSANVAGPSFGDAPRPPMPGAVPRGPELGKASGCGKVALLVGAVLLLLTVGFCVAIYFGYRYINRTVRSSEPYALAIAKLKESEVVRERLGEIKDTGFPFGSFAENSNGSGSAIFSISVTGTKGSGRYNVELLRTKRVWRIMVAKSW
jgi:Cytochrome oxidase complex assembly protein 1/zinc-ribbon domain